LFNVNFSKPQNTSSPERKEKKKKERKRERMENTKKIELNYKDTL
jgi:hypothetical protein